MAQLVPCFSLLPSLLHYNKAHLPIPVGTRQGWMPSLSQSSYHSADLFKNLLARQRSFLLWSCLIHFTFGEAEAQGKEDREDGALPLKSSSLLERHMLLRSNEVKGSQPNGRISEGASWQPGSCSGLVCANLFACSQPFWVPNSFSACCQVGARLNTVMQIVIHSTSSISKDYWVSHAFPLDQ